MTKFNGIGIAGLLLLVGCGGDGQGGSNEAEQGAGGASPVAGSGGALSSSGGALSAGGTPAAGGVAPSTGGAGPGGAGPGGADGGVEVAQAISSVPRNLNPQVTQAALDELGAGNRAFAFDVYAKSIEERADDVFISPYSMSTALAMTYAGARENTKAQLGAALHFTLPDEQLHAAFNAVDLELAKRASETAGEGQGFALEVSNALWMQDGYPFLPSFLDPLAENYGAGVYLLDYMRDPEIARVTINGWVAGRTNQRIPELLAPKLITDLTRLVLTNTIFFKANWYEQFDPKDTAPGTFHGTGGDTSPAMMKQTADLPYVDGDGYAAVDLAYRSPEVRMLLVLPDADEFAAIEAGLDDAFFQTVRGAMTAHATTITLPKFRIESKSNLKESTFDWADVFSETDADFSGMTGTKELFVAAIVHQAFVEVNEEGTEAAAATAVVVNIPPSIPEPPPPATITLDRPFLFVVYDRPTGQILFLGRLLSAPSP